MKNVHLLPTDKPSRLVQRRITKEVKISSLNNPQLWNNINIYITSDEGIKEGDWCIDKHNVVYKQETDKIFTKFNGTKKIILTTDQDLIKDGVQPIDDEFLEWFVKNPSCEFVETQCSGRNCIEDFGCIKEGCNGVEPLEIIIPQEELKHPKVFSENGNELFFDEQGYLIREEPDYEKIKRTLVEMRKVPMTFVLDERMYSEEDLREAFKAGEDSKEDEINGDGETSFNEWFEQFKKK
jgi:hypothetical protein